MASAPPSHPDRSTGAEIIPFRPRQPAAGAGENRLRSALGRLEAAIASQREAVAEWRLALVRLRASTGGLAHSLGAYRCQLDRLRKGVSELDSQARALHAWAERAEQSGRSTSGSGRPRAEPEDVKLSL
jgi:hypothetical protein